MYETPKGDEHKGDALLSRHLCDMGDTRRRCTSPSTLGGLPKILPVTFVMTFAGSNPGNGTRAHIRTKNRTTCDLRHERSRKKKIFFKIFIHTENIYFNTQKNNAHDLCIDIGDGLRLP